MVTINRFIYLFSFFCCFGKGADFGFDIALSELEAPSFFYSGVETTTTLYECAVICSNFYEVEESLFPIVTLEGFCFCSSKREVINHNTGLPPPTKSFTVEKCDNPLLSPCVLNGGVSNDAYDIVKDYAINITDDVIVPQQGNISFTVTNGAFLSPPSYSFEYSTKSEVFKIIKDDVASLYFIYPGFTKTFTESDISNLTKVFLHHFTSNISNVYFDILHAIVDGDKKDYYFKLGSGTNVTIDLQNPFSSKNIQVNTDINMLSTGEASHMIRFASTPITISPSDDQLHILTKTSFREDGLLLYLEVNVEKSGSFLLSIIRPICSTGQSFSVINQSCGGEDTFLNGMNLIDHIPISSVFNGDIKIVQTVIITLVTTGYQLISLKDHNIEVIKGDMVAVRYDSKGAKLYAAENTPESYTYIESNFVPNTVASVVTSSKVLPAIRVYFTKLFLYSLYHDGSIINKKALTFKADVSNQVTNEQIEKIVQVEKKLTSIKFVANQPRNSTVGFYDTTLIDDLYIYFNVTYDNIPDVKLIFFIPQINETLTTKENQRYTTFQTAKLGPGTFTVYAIASNLVSKVNTSIEISILSRIKKIHSKASKTTVQINETFDISVHIDSGNDVSLLVDFDDNERIEKEFFENAAGGIYFNTTHRYSACNIYEISSVVTNKATEKENKDSLTITTICQLLGLEIATKPILSSTGEVIISASETLELKIILESGSFVEYDIIWGDNKTDNEKSKTLRPSDVYKYHQFKPGEYDVEITARSFGSESKKKVRVISKQCAPPPVSFTYGTKERPLNVTREREQDFIALWEYKDLNCKDIIESDYMPVAWSITYPNGIEVAETPKKIGQSTTYTVKPKELALGSYSVILKMKYEGVTTSYEAYFVIIETPPVAIINIGSSIDISKYQLVNQNATLYEFAVDARKSYDPEKSIDKMKFSWSCNVLSNKTFITEMKKNLTSPSDFCLEEKRVPINQAFGGSSDILKINTKYFIEGITYRIQLDISVGSRRATTHGVVTVVPGTPPPIDVSCEENCEEKINTLEQIKYKFNCNTTTSCPKNLVVRGEWQVLMFKKDGTKENLDEKNFYTLLQSTNLALKARAIEPDAEVHFMLRAYYLSRPNAVTTMRIDRYAAGIPYGGNCKAWPDVGYASKFIFNINCDGWINTEGSTRYKFYYDRYEKPSTAISTTNGKNLKLIPTSKEYTSFLKNISLPAGIQEHNFQVGIVVYIQNKFDSYVESEKMNLTVYPPGYNQSNAASEEAVTSVLSSEPTDPNDVDSVVSFAENVASVVDHYLESTKDSFEPEINELTNLPDENDVTRKAELKEEQNEKLKNVTDKVANLLANVPISSLSSLEKVSEAVSSVSSNPDIITDKTTDTLMNVMEGIVNEFGALTAGQGSEAKQQRAKPCYMTISNFLLKFQSGSSKLESYASEVLASEETFTQQPTTDMPTKSSSSTMTPTEKFKVKANDTNNRSKKVLQMLNVVNTEILKSKIKDEQASQLSTNMFKTSLQKSSSASMNNTMIGTSKKYGFRMGSDTSKFGDNPNVPVLVQSVNHASSPYLDINSGNMDTEVEALELKDENGKPLSVKNLTDPIIITIKNDKSKMKESNISLYKPFEFKHRSFRVTTGCNMLIDIRPLDDFKNETILTVYIQYGRKPGPTDFDVKLKISDGNTEIILNKLDAQVMYQNVSMNITRSVFIANTADGALVMWNFDNFTLAPYINSSKLHFAFVYSGKLHKLQEFENPFNYDLLELRGAFNYSFMAFCSSCAYWNEENQSWQGDGCELRISDTNLEQTSCAATHLTAFGGFYVAPNPLPPLSFALLKEGYVLLVTVSIALLFWVVGVIVLRRIDKADVAKIGVCPLMDNKTEDTFLYEITVNTGSRRYAGTESNVCIIVAGDEGNTGIRQLKDNQRKTFQRASADVFIMTTEKSLGDLNYIRIWHDNSEGGWYLRSIEIIDLQTEEKYLFIATRWLSVDRFDGMVDCLLPVASEKELTDFNYLFTTKTRRDFSDAHIWYSIYARPPRSSFTRTQRLSVAISLLFTSMTASVMFFDAIPPGNAADENRIGSFSFNWRQVYVAIISACITVPVNLLLVGLFRSIRPDLANSTKNDESDSNLNDSSIELNSQSSAKQETIINENVPKELLAVSVKEEMNSADPKRKKKKPFYLPRWFLIPTWFLCIVTILGCGFIVVWYGMAFGNKKSLDWLASVSICLFQDIVVMQPFKVFAMALFIALVVRKLDEEEKSEVEKQARHLAKDEAWLHQIVDETSIFDRIDTEDLKPPDLSKLDWMREIRLRELKMYAITRELILYLFFTAVVFLIGYLARDQSAYLQTRDIEELLSLKIRDKTKLTEEQQFGKIMSQSHFWPWMDSLFLDEVFPKPWYNLDAAYNDTPKVRDFPGNIFLNDLNSKIVNGIRIRQVRVKPDSCNMAPEVEPFMTLDCASDYNVVEEDSRHFKSNWSLPYSDDEKLPLLTPLTKPWSYQTWKDLDGFPFWAELNTYFGGGYVVEVFPRWENKAILKSLKESKWVDRHSRAVIIEFTLYNGATNYFNSVTIVVEFPPGGGAIPYFQCTTFQLYRYAKHNMIFAIACEVLFLILMIIFTVREMRLLYRTGWAYFKEFWNLVEISNIILTITAIVFYTYREILGRSLLERLPSKKPDGFINFQFAAMWDMFFTYVIALICFFVTLKFIKLLRFNRRISLLSYTLKRAWYPLSMFGICFGIVLTAVVFSSSIIFGTNLYGYRDYQKTFASIISLLLGKFSYYQFENTNRILGPIFFFAFNIMVNWIIMNMMISILTDVFAEVQAEVLAQSNDYEIVDFIIGHFKDWFGFGHSKKRAEREWQERSFIEDRKSQMGKERSSSRLTKRSLKLRHLSNYEHDDIFGFAKSSHWRDTNEESELLKANDFTEDELNETVDKFIKCFNVLYFDDQMVADQMNEVVKSEIKHSSK